MRSDYSTMQPLLENFAARTGTADGRAADRLAAPIDGTPVPVPDAPEPHYDLLDTLLRRRSSLQYSAEPVDPQVVIPLLQGALRRDCADWGLDAEAGALEAVVFALRSVGEPGIYRVTPDECAIVAPVSAIGAVEDLGVQREFATAAGIVSIYGGLDKADAWAGPHGYRLCVTRAAAVVYDFYLRAQAHGLVGTLFAGFIASAVRTLVHSDGVTRHPLISATYARPPRET